MCPVGCVWGGWNPQGYEVLGTPKDGTGSDPIVTDARALLPTGKIGCEQCAQWPVTNPVCAAG